MKRGLVRIGVYCPGSGAGGPWRYMHSILKGMDPREFDAVLFSDLDRYDPAPWIRAVRLNGKTAANTPGPQRIEPRPAATAQTEWKPLRIVPKFVKVALGFRREAQRMAAALRPYNLELFHTNNAGCEESPVAGHWAGIRNVVGTFHVNPDVDPLALRSGPGYRMLETLSNRCLTKAIAVSHATKAQWLRRTPMVADRIETIHNGIDCNRFARRQDREVAKRALDLPADALVVGSVGRLDEVKGLRFLLSAVAALASGYRKLVLVLAGDGPSREELRRQSEALGTADRVRFLGFVADVQPVLDALDIFALPSLSETLGYAHLEAMATGLPAVGTTVGGVPEVIVNGKTGLLVPPRDAKALAAALRTLLDSPDLGQRMGAAGRERVEKYFTEREMVERTIGLYRRLLASRTNASS